MCYLLLSDGHHLSCGDCLEDKSEDYQNCSVLYYVPQLYTVISTLTRAVLTTSDFGSVNSFMCVFCVFYLPRASLFILFFGILAPVCFVLSVPVQVIAWKDSSPNGPNMCREGHKTLLTDSDPAVTKWLFSCMY